MSEAGKPTRTSTQSVAWTGGSEHWIDKGVDGVRLFAWHKPATRPGPCAGTILFVHGASTAAQPAFDLQVPGRDDTSAMDWFAARGFDTWCLDNEGYGRSSKHRNLNFDVANGTADLVVASEYMLQRSRTPWLLVYGVSSGALKVVNFARQHPERVAAVALDGFVWTGEGSRTLAGRKKRLDEWRSKNRRPIDQAFIEGVFTRDHAGTAEDDVVQAFARAILALDDSMPTGTYVDLCTRLPLLQPAELTVPTLLMHGQYDGGATLDDVAQFYVGLPNPDKQLIVLPGVAHSSFQQKNRLRAYRALEAFFTRPALVYQPAPESEQA